jgi:hypothetical protein
LLALDVLLLLSTLLAAEAALAPVWRVLRAAISLLISVREVVDRPPPA